MLVDMTYLQRFARAMRAFREAWSQDRPHVDHKVRYGGYTPGKNSADLKTPTALRNPAPSRPALAGAVKVCTHPSSVTCDMPGCGASAANGCDAIGAGWRVHCRAGDDWWVCPEHPVEVGPILDWWGK